MQPANMHPDGSSPLDDIPIMCTEEKLNEQCFDVSKGIAVSVVALASLVYSTRPAAAVKETQPPNEEPAPTRGSE